jgi:hypothetical protein
MYVPLLMLQPPEISALGYEIKFVRMSVTTSASERFLTVDIELVTASENVTESSIDLPMFLAYESADVNASVKFRVFADRWSRASLDVTESLVERLNVRTAVIGKTTVDWRVFAALLLIVTT